MTMIVSTGSGLLTVGAFHRAFASPVPIPDVLPGCTVSREDPMDALSGGRIAVVSPTGSIGVALDPETALVTPFGGIAAAIAAELILPPLGLREDQALYIDDAAGALVVARYGTAILLPGSDVRSVIDAARAGVLLPPKSTRFRPKPMRGLLMRSL